MNEVLRKMYACDPISALIRNKLKMQPWLATLVTLLALNIPIAIIATINGYWVLAGGRTGLLFDFAWWGYQLTAVPATLFFYFRLPIFILDVFEGLKTNKVLKLPERIGDQPDAYDEFIGKFEKAYCHRGWVIGSIVTVIVFMKFANLPEFEKFTGWQTESDLIFWYHAFFWLVIFFVGLLVALKIFLTIYWFNRLFIEFNTNIRVLHPDKAGGLSPLGNFSVKIGYMIGIYGFVAVIAMWSHTDYLMESTPIEIVYQPATLTMIFIYVILAPIVFFSPIGSAHSSMKNAKYEFIMQIADQFERDFSKINSLLDNDVNSLRKGIDKIEQLQKIHNVASNFPVWPFNVPNLVRFFSSTLFPVFMAILPSLISLFAE